MSEIEIKIKVNICLRCHHLWQKRKDLGDSLPLTCPNCNSPYWRSPRKTRGKEKEKKKKLLFHGEEVLDSNFDEIYGSPA